MTASDVLLTADDARVTVLRSLASSAFGAWVLELPDKIEVEDLYPPSAPGNEPGFVAALPVDGGRVGGLARRFVRADVKITVEGEHEDDLGDLAGLGGSTSTVDRVLSEAADRVSGEFFLESDISKAGLNGWVPLVDFEVGDLVWVRVLGRLVRLPVTRIDPVVSEHDVVDWTVHVGGQVVSDDDARLAENDVVRAALVQDRRELAGVVGGLSRRVSRAQGTADGAQVSAESAQGTADLAVSRASELESFLAGGGDGDLVDALAAINSQLAEQGEAAASGLVPAYLRLNTQLWEAQKLINEQQKLIDAAQDKAREAQKAAVNAQASMLKMTREYMSGSFVAEADRTSYVPYLGVGVVMPRNERWLRVYRTPGMKKNASVLVIYNNADSRLYSAHHNSSEWKLQRADSSNLQQALSKDGYIDQWEIWLPLGSVAASMIIVDSIPWK